MSVIVFPTDSRLWMDYGQSSRRIAMVKAGTGDYDIDIPPGDYYVLALPTPPGADWLEAGNLARLSLVAQRVNVAEGERATMNLTPRAVAR